MEFIVSDEVVLVVVCWLWIIFGIVLRIWIGGFVIVIIDLL